MLARLRAFHDRLTLTGFAGGALCVGFIAVSFWYEVVARYFFNAPTNWAYDFASYALCPMIFLSIPELARQRAHVVVAYMVEVLPPRSHAPIGRFVMIVAALVCLFGAWISGAETWRQYLRGVETISAWPIQKWTISIFIPYGFAMTGLHFLRQFLDDAPAARSPDGAVA